MRCKICNSETIIFDMAVVLRKYDVAYYQCPQCGFIQTEAAYWINEAYSDAIAYSDIGLIGRNILLSSQCSAVFKLALLPPRNEHFSFLDYGAGYGMFVRMMRDKGFDLHWYDKYCQNLFAKGFEKQHGKYDVATAVELFEHLTEPLTDIEEMFKLADNIVFTTGLLPNPIPKINAWRYYCPETGQHIAFYTPRALEIVAKKFNRYYVHYGDFHAFTKVKIPKWKWAICCKLHKLINLFFRKQSLLSSDYEKITGNKLS
ncbi:MAG: hypothetical protein PHAS_01536 [Phascolarctobacterium sp.]